MYPMKIETERVETGLSWSITELDGMFFCFGPNL
jgi:hypothetical protein